MHALRCAFSPAFVKSWPCFPLQPRFGQGSRVMSLLPHVYPCTRRPLMLSKTLSQSVCVHRNSPLRDVLARSWPVCDASVGCLGVGSFVSGSGSMMGDAEGVRNSVGVGGVGSDGDVEGVVAKDVLVGACGLLPAAMWESWVCWARNSSIARSLRTHPYCLHCCLFLASFWKSRRAVGFPLGLWVSFMSIR